MGRRWHPPLGDRYQMRNRDDFSTNHLVDVPAGSGGAQRKDARKAASAGSSADFLKGESDAPEEAGREEEPTPAALTAGLTGEAADALRLYLRRVAAARQMKREDEVAAAKRIEEGEQEVTDALLEARVLEAKAGEQPSKEVVAAAVTRLTSLLSRLDASEA
jgi:hypothetical protein